MPLAPTISYTIRDNDQDPAETSVHVPSGSTLARYTEFAQRHAESIEGVILGVFDETARLSVPVDISALTSNVALDTSDVEQVGAYQFADGNNEPVDVNVPCVQPLATVPFTDGLDLAATDILNFVTAMTDGLAVTGGTIQPCSISESDIQDIFFARKETRNSGRKRR